MQLGSAQKDTAMSSKTGVTALSITAIVIGGIATLLDRHGRRICGVRLDRIGAPEPAAIESRIWNSWAKLATTLGFWASQKDSRDPWCRKAENLAVSFRLRLRQKPHLGGMRRLDNFSTPTWHEAASRMVAQAHNRLLRFDRSGWIRWSHTVSNNQNKRADAWRRKRTTLPQPK